MDGRADSAQSYKWFNLAAALGHAPSREARDRALTRLNPKEVAESQRAATEMYYKLAGKLAAQKAAAHNLSALLASYASKKQK